MEWKYLWWSGIYSYSTFTLNGCDSSATLDLTISYSDTSTQTITACDSYEWNGNIYTESGIYNFETTSVSGCDSVAILNLTINNSSSSTHDVTACDNYEWNGTTYSETGIFTFNTTQ